jgi:hypothetical protein
MGNLYIGDGYVVIRLSSGIVTRFAGKFLGPGFEGDGGGPATAASLGSVNGLAVDAGGNLYIGDGNNQRVREVSTSGIITTFAGGGSLGGGSEDGGPATSAMLGGIRALSFDSRGNLYLADGGLVRKITPGGIITTVAGVRGVENAIVGDGGPATNTLFGLITGLAFDSSGTLYIADSSDNRVRTVGSDGIVRTFAGSSSGSFSGDGAAEASTHLWSVPEMLIRKFSDSLARARSAQIFSMAS